MIYYDDAMWKTYMASELKALNTHAFLDSLTLLYWWYIHQSLHPAFAYSERPLLLNLEHLQTFLTYCRYYWLSSSAVSVHTNSTFVSNFQSP